MTFSPNTPIYEHDAKAIIPHLVSHLPHSISLLRRIQHSLSYPSSTAKVLATFPSQQISTPPPADPWLAARVDLFRGRETQIVLYSSLEKTHSSIDPIDPVAASPGGDDDTTPSAAAADPTDDNNKVTVATFTAPPAQLEKAQTQFLALLSYIKIHLLPEYRSSLQSTSPAQNAQKRSEPNDSHLIPPPPPQAFLIGSLHTGLYALLMRSGVYCQLANTTTMPNANAAANGNASALADPLPGLKIHRVDYPPYYKYFFRRAVFASDRLGRKKHPGQDEDGLSLPPGYRYHDRQGRTGVQDVHLDLVQSRTHIPRSRTQLASMPGVAIYHDPGDGESDENETETPIAWGFLGLDGALASLHVEPGHRGKGLALCLSREVMRRGMGAGVFGTDEPNSASDSYSGLDDTLREMVGAWVHTEVAQYNRASRRVMEKIGGEVWSSVVWMVVEVCGSGISDGRA